MVIVDDAAVGADGDVNAGLLEVLVPRLGHLDDRGGLPPADALLLPRDADGAAADADFYKVRPGPGQEEEAVPVHHVAGPHLHGVAVLLADPLDGAALPLRKALGGIDAQHVHPGLQEGGDPLLVVPRVDARPHDVPLLGVQQLALVLLVAVVVLAEDEVPQAALPVDEGEGIELMLPDDVVGFLQGGGVGGGNQVLKLRHEVPDPGIGCHAADPVIPAGDDAHQLPGGGAVAGDGHGGMAGALLQLQDIRQGGIGADVAVAGDKARLVALDAGHHSGLLLDGLAAVDKGDSALPRQGNGHLFAGDRLHDGGGEGDVHGKGTLLPPLAELYQRGAKADISGDAFRRGIAGHQEVFAKGMGGFAEIKRHAFLLLSFFTYSRRPFPSGIFSNKDTRKRCQSQP